MSLINSVLRDLDARKSDGPGAGQFQQHVRAVPDQRARRGQRRIAGTSAAIAIVAAAASAGWWFQSSDKAPALPLAVKPSAIPALAKVSAPIIPAPPGTVSSAESPTPQGASANSESSRDAVAPAPAVIAAREPAASTARSAPATPTALAPRLAQRDTSAAPSETGASNSAAQTLQQNNVTASTPQERAEYAYTQGLDLLRQGKQNDAIKTLEQAARAVPRHEAARQALIAALIDIGRKEEAARYAQEGLDEQAAQPAVAMTLARLQVERGELRPAIATLERTLPHAAAQSGYEAFLAALLQRDEQHRRAVEHYLVALRTAPEAGLWWMGLGISYQALQRQGEALDAFARAKASGSLTAELSTFVDSRLAQLKR